MAYIQALSKELSNDPLERGYSGMTDQEAANDLNTAYRTQEQVKTIEENHGEMMKSLGYELEMKDVLEA